MTRALNERQRHKTRSPAVTVRPIIDVIILFVFQSPAIYFWLFSTTFPAVGKIMFHQQIPLPVN